MLSSGNRLWLQSRGVTPAMAGLLHQHRLLAAHIGDAHVSFADLDAEQCQQVEEQLVERLGQP